MGLAYYISVDHPDIVTEDISGKAVAAAMENLNLLTEELELESLQSFLGQSLEEMADLVGIELGPDEVAVAGPNWFAPETGLRVVEGLLEALAAQPDRIENSSSVAHDLEAYKKVLLQAAERGARWHLSIDV